jgi:hypothetical protein
MATKDDKNQQNSALKFYCENCDYGTCKKSSYDTHLASDKHKRLTKDLQKGRNSAKNLPDTSETSICSCGKQYQHRQSLWKHKKTCSIISCKEDLNDSVKQQQLIEYLLKENSEFKHLMLEQNKQMVEQNKSIVEIAKNSGNNNTNNSHNTTNNNSTNNFNLNFFLNETCKNAMNIMDFVAQLQVGIKELEDTGRLGFSEGISKIFINGLKQLDISDRPIHCSDSKREVVYIKDKDQWNKETEDKTILTNAIKHVAHKNMKQISEWTKGNPEFNDSTSKQNDRYLNIVCESMSGSSQEETNKNYNKIIKNIVKGTIIDKDTISVT